MTDRTDCATDIAGRASTGAPLLAVTLAQAAATFDRAAGTAMVTGALTLALAVAGSPAAYAATTVDTIAEIDSGSGGLALDADGNIYTADFGPFLGRNPEGTGNKIVRVTPDGKTSLFADGFKGASGNAFDSHGNLFQSNIRGNFISRVTPAGEVSTFATEGFKGPVGIAIDGDDNLYVNSCGGGWISKIAADGTVTRFVQSPLLQCPNGLTFGDAGNLYVANFGNGDVVRVTPEGEITRLVTLPGNNNGHVTYSRGDLYVVGRSAHQIFKVSFDGSYEVFAGSGEKGGDDGSPTEASFCFPNDIAASPDGRTFYINDVADHTTTGPKLGPTRIRRIRIGS